MHDDDVTTDKNTKKISIHIEIKLQTEYRQAFFQNIRMYEMIHICFQMVHVLLSRDCNQIVLPIWGWSTNVIILSDTHFFGLKILINSQ